MSLTAAQGRPLRGGAPDGWCENYALVGNDPLAGVNVCFYTGSQPFGRSLWHEILLVSLPGGRVLTWKSAGRGASEKGSTAARPSAGSMSRSCARSGPCRT